MVRSAPKALCTTHGPPVPGKEPTIARDHEYVRHGTVSILAGIDLHSGHLFANVEDRHRSGEFIALLKQLDAHYPEGALIRVVRDNHSAHISTETMACLSEHPGRFEYVHAPKHGSWLNLIECAFSKMACTFLRHIRVTSKEELKQRILKGIDEIKKRPARARRPPERGRANSTPAGSVRARTAARYTVLLVLGTIRSKRIGATFHTWSWAGVSAPCSA